ncbi:Ig-like domain-containing protein, partial [Limnohabitans sp.]|uniref:Ig-like domain-containing protein n=1 Tax=Limnohabitans sp. TaxID=1907725 RepID=UPI0031FE3A9F
VNGEVIGTTTVLPDGTWSITSTGPVPEGTLNVTATDINGEEGTDTAPYVDNKPPLVSINEPITQNTDGTIKVTGTGEKGADIEVKDVNGEVIGTTTVLPDGTWSVTSEGPVPEGTLSATATDINGEEGTDTAQYEDNTGPVIAITSLTDPDTNGKINAVGTAEPESTVTVTWPDGTTSTTLTLANGSWSVESPTVQRDGEVKATATDINDNVSDPVTAQYVDSTPPKIDIESLTQNDDGTLTVSGISEAGATVVVKDKDGTLIGSTTVGTNGSWTVTSPDTVPEGDIKAKATDVNNQEATDTAVFTLSPAQEVEIDEPITQNANGTITVTGTGEKGADIEVKDVNGVLIGTTTVLENGTWSLNSQGEVPPGLLTATSSTVNNQESSDTANYENTPVAVMDEASGSEDSSTLTGDVSTNDTHNDGTEVYALTSSATGNHGTLVFNADGTWTYTRTANLNAIQTAVEETFTYSVTDSAGKTSSADLQITLEPVNDAPVVTVSNAFVSYLENQAPISPKFGTITLSDVDSANLQSATVRVADFSSNAFVAGDVLSVTLPVGSPIQSSGYNAATGVLTLTGVATKAQYEEVLNAVKFHNTRDDIASGPRKVFWSVTDDAGLANTVTRFSSIGVTNVNDAPILSDANLNLPTIEPITTELAPGEQIPVSQGSQVGSFLVGVTDPDGASATKGIAIVGVNQELGKLYLSIDGGQTWTSPAFEVSENNAILLRNQANRRIYFRPNVGVEGSITDALTIRAWDTANNVPESVNGQQVEGRDATVVGGITAFSSASDTVALVVASSATAPEFNGTAGDDDITGSIGADVILGKGGVDQIKADDGHDKIVINADNVQKLAAQNDAEFDGEADINTLKLSGSGMFLDLTNVTVQGKLKNFSVLDITGNGANSLKLNLDRVASLSGAADNSATSDVDESKMLVVQADLGDAVVLENTLNWLALSGLTGESLSVLYGAPYGFVGGHKYTQFSQNGATLFVDELAPVADIVGTHADDALQGTANAEVIFGNGGADLISAGAGNDTVILNAKSVVALGQANTVDVDGGDGVNVLKLSGVNVTMDLTNTTVAGKLDNFSVLDLSMGNGNTVKLSLQQVLDLPSGVADNSATSDVYESKMLVVHGTGLNTLQLADSVDWTAVTNLGGTSLQNTYGTQYGFEVGRSYTQYTNAASSATLFVDQLLVQDLQ